jgi:hypothetical protein
MVHKGLSRVNDGFCRVHFVPVTVSCMAMAGGDGVSLRSRGCLAAPCCALPGAISDLHACALRRWVTLRRSSTGGSIRLRASEERKQGIIRQVVDGASAHALWLLYPARFRRSHKVLFPHS